MRSDLQGLFGATLQGLFRNPLADPGLIGVSSGAALGAVGMIVFGTQLYSDLILPCATPCCGSWGVSCNDLPVFPTFSVVLIFSH